MAGSTTSSKFTDVLPKALESSRLLAPTKASLARAKGHSKGLSSDSDDGSDRVTGRRSVSPVKSSRVVPSDSESAYSSDEEKSLKKAFVERRRGSIGTSNTRDNQNKAAAMTGPMAAKKYSESLRLATKAKVENQKNSVTRLGEPRSPRSPRSPRVGAEQDLSPRKHSSSPSGHEKTVEEKEAATIIKVTRVPIWPDLSPKVTVKISPQKSDSLKPKSWTSRVSDQTGHDGYHSPDSTLEFRLSEDSNSPTSTTSTARPGTELESDSDLDSDKRFNLQEFRTKEEVYEPLEYAPLDFVGDVEGMEQDLEYVRRILVATGFSERNLPEWHTSQVPINPSMFEELENGIPFVQKTSESQADEARKSESRRQRMLLFDAVNEALARRLLPHIELPIYVKPTKGSVKPPPVGKTLLKEVWTEIHEWPVPTSDEVYDILDDAARRDMVKGLEKWNEFGLEESEVVFELESLISQKLIDEAITCFAAIEFKRLKKNSNNGSNGVSASPVTPVK